jgi:hypothetical protein
LKERIVLCSKLLLFYSFILWLGFDGGYVVVRSEVQSEKEKLSRLDITSLSHKIAHNFILLSTTFSSGQIFNQQIILLHTPFILTID